MAIKTIGILGAGQLGRMLALAGYPLGLNFVCLDPNPNSPAGQIAPQIQAEYTDKVALAELARRVDVITYEFENVPHETIDICQKLKPVFPGKSALAVAQDRLNEKNLARTLNIPTAQFSEINSLAELSHQAQSFNNRCILKARRLGYDGKGQFVINTRADVEKAWSTLSGQALILESFVDFTRELSLILVRSNSGELRSYPLIENQHREGILRRSISPCETSPALNQLAQKYGQAIAEKLDYCGVLAIEFFEAHNKLIFNEMAPRVHNSGHWTIEGSECSQFENHLRAVADLPLGSCNNRGYSLMYNIIGELPNTLALLSQGAHLHLYGKTERAGRKLGHYTFVCEDGLERNRILSGSISAGFACSQS